MAKQQSMIPSQQKGASSDTIHTVQESSMASAVKRYAKAVERLLDINHWHIIAGGGAVFTLFDTTGKPFRGNAEEGCYVRIDIPAIPPSRSGQGYEWVRIEKIEHDDRCTSIMVRPASPPFLTGKATCHFFAPSATSTFSVTLQHLKIQAAVHGRNENPNTEVPGLMERARNFVVGLLAMLGLNKKQWMRLVKGLVKP